MSSYEERPNRFPWPPVVYVIAIALAVILHWLLPLPWFGSPFADFLFAIGILVALAALAIDFAAMRTLSRARTTILPHRGSEHLVIAGPYSFTRNPIYLGNTMLMIAAGLVFGMVWFLLLAPVAAFVTQKLAIEREEQHLALRFGKKYRDYQKRVRRWI
jgi:protein-S-isoprenylcysteine O-methyltransferase Ste14